MSSVLSMPLGYYDALKRLTAEVSGVVMEEGFQFTIETRLSLLAREEGYNSLVEMVQSMFKSGDSRLALQMVASMLVRDTHFFREKKGLIHFSDFVLPRIYDVYGERTIKILIVGCNSGQEAYSAAILADKLKTSSLPKLNVEFTAIDYPSRALERAEAGRYTHFDVQRGLPVRDMLSYFTRIGEDWVVNDKLKNRITFRETHLLRLPKDLGEYHAILCRDVMSRFQHKVQVKFIRKLSQHIKSRGFLLVGETEALPQTIHPWIASGGPVNVHQRAKTEAEIKAEEASARAAHKLLHPDPERFLDESKAKETAPNNSVSDHLDLKTA